MTKATFIIHKFCASTETPPLPTKQTERVISIFVVGFVRFVLPQIKLSAHGENSSLFASYTQCQATSIGAVSNGTLPVLQ
jgi:hypothetical protein